VGYVAYLLAPLFGVTPEEMRQQDPHDDAEG
jgi:hypothetical protein